MSCTNAKKELVGHVKQTGKTVKCAKLKFETLFGDDDETIQIVLSPGFTEHEYQRFLVKLDREYDSGYGGQELFGVIWFMDGTWSERKEYDGSERWSHKTCPDWSSYSAK